MKKMSTWFKLPVCCMPSEVGSWMEHVNFGVKGLSSHHCEAIEDAINNHDRLTEENAKLREMLSLLSDSIMNTKGKMVTLRDFDLAISSQQLLNQLKDQNNDK